MPTATLSQTHDDAHKNLVIGALGIVFGDIGTSPLYTMKECFGPAHGLMANEANVLGILSLVFWSILIVISLKYVLFIMRADNKGEGGIMALMSLVAEKASIRPGYKTALVMLGLCGASLFYGDGIITPAISVLSAVEGLEVLEPDLEAYIVPIALAVLIGLFMFQQRGTSAVGSLFGPIMLVWFACLAALGLNRLADNPAVLAAANPGYALAFFLEHGVQGFLVLGAVVLAVTGGEALYADMGHFGRVPIRKAWFFFVLPALLINYFGQGALLIQNPEAARNPFYLLVPPGALGWMIGLATLATIIASQAVISGAFSLTSQAIQLGFSPRLGIQYTSEEERGQIYIPAINWILMLGIIGLVLGFRSSSALAAAYGIAVTGTMAIDTILAFVVVYSLWRWNPVASAVGAVLLLIVDLTFFGATLDKIPDGGWFPLVAGGLVLTVLSSWKKGRELLLQTQKENELSVDAFLDSIAAAPPLRVPGTAVFMTSSHNGVPAALLNNLKHNKMLHETTVLMTVIVESVPRVSGDRRREVRRLGEGFYRVNLHYGFMERPNVPRVLKSSSRDFDVELADTTYFLSRETLIARPTPKMSLWRLKLFVAMARNMTSAAVYFRIPSDRVIELGTQIVL